MARFDRYYKRIADFLESPESSNGGKTSAILYPGEARRFAKKFPIIITEAPHEPHITGGKKRYIIEKKVLE